MPTKWEKYMIKRIGIECESIENDTWGVARMTSKLLEEISRRPELEKELEFCLYFKSKIPEYSYLKNPIFKKKILKLPVIPASFSLYYYIYLPVYLWFKRVDVMFFPNYMLPLIFSGKSVVMLTDDIYYESRNPKLPFRYRLAYRIFTGWAAAHASRIMAISETSKKELTKLFGIKQERISVNYLGVDSPDTQNRNNENQYVLYVGQAFPRRHLKETILAFEKLITQQNEHPYKLENVSVAKLKLIAIGPDKYERPTISPLISEVNNRLGREAIIHKDYVKNSELVELYAGAKALIYVSDREAFGLPPMEALSFGVPPVIADNELGHELFGEYAFYVGNPNPDGIAEGVRQALIESEKIQKIKSSGPEFVKKYNWKSFTDKFLEIIKNDY